MMALSTERAKVADSVAGPSAEQQLASFLEKFTLEVASLAESILATMRALYPTANLLVYFAAKGDSRLIIKSISAKQRPRRPAK
jgi:KaiC/GvpD/RAD55 family RecA-like ATPase